MTIMNATKTATLVALVLAAGFAVTGCSQTSAPTPTPAVTETVEATAPAETPVVEVTETPAPEVVADEFSQVIDGVVYQGTETAPIRIGTDIPGQAPAAEAQLERGTSEALAVESDKYIVYVAPTEGGWYWKVFGMSLHGSFRELTNSGLRGDALFGSRDEALAAPKVIDGRTLDRAEYLLAAEN